MHAARCTVLCALLAAVPSTATPQQQRQNAGVPAFQSLSVDTDGTLFAGTERHGVLRSADGGATWASAGLPGKNVAALVRTSSGALIAGITGWNGQLHRSADRGASWPRVEIEPFVHALATAPSGAIIASSGTHVLRSVDDGRSWQPVRSPSGPFDVNALIFSSDGTLFGGSEAGVFQSSDQGMSWSRLGQWSFGTVRALAVDEEGRLFTGSNQGIFRFDTGSGRWVRSHFGLPTATVWSLLASSGGFLAAATDSGIAISRDTGRTWELRVPGGRSRALALSADGGAVLAGQVGSAALRRLPVETPSATAEHARDGLTQPPGTAAVGGRRTLYLAWARSGEAMGLFPIAVVEQGEFKDPRAGFYPQRGKPTAAQFAAATARINRAYFPAGQVVSYRAAGAVIGRGRIRTPPPPSPSGRVRCDYPGTTLEDVTGVLPGEALALLPDPTAGRTRPALPTATQRAVALNRARQMLLDSGVPLSVATRVREVSQQPLLVSDLDRDGRPELIGSFEAYPAEEDVDGYGVLLILSRDANSNWWEAYSAFYTLDRPGKPTTRWFLDYLDVDGDGVDEAITSSIGGVYSVLKKVNGRWTQVYDAYSGMAITWCVEY